MRWGFRNSGSRERLPNYADHVIAVSDEIRTAMREGSRVSDENVSVIPNGVEPEFLEVERPTGGDAAKGKKVLVYAGGLAPYQGIDLLLEAFARARQADPELVLRIITGSSFRDFEKAAAELGVREHIELLDAPLAELPAHLAAADAALNPRGFCEGLPQKLLNYMAAGCAIVSCAGSARFLRNEETGLIVPDGDAKAFAEAMLRIVDRPDLAKRIGRNARAFVRSELSWEHTVDRVEEVYAKLVRDRVRRA